MPAPLSPNMSLYRMRFILLPLFLAFSLLTPVLGQNQPVKQPNIIIILNDDHGIGDVSCYRDADVKTPAIDSLARDGMRFTNMRANCTVCSPSRAALLTGCFPDRVGVPGVIRTAPENSWGYFSPRFPTLGNQLRNLGYETAMIGKWHLGLESPNRPNERGFDYFHGFLGDMMDSYTDHRRHGNNYMRHNQETIDPPGHATEIFANWTIDYLRKRSEQSDKPFFLYLAFNAPHFPIEPPEAWLRKVQQRAPDMPLARAKNVAFVEHLDHWIGKVLATLEETGLSDNTIVALSADNGGSLPHAQNNDPWRDGKTSHYDGGLRVPFLVRWPGVVPPGSTSDYQGLLFDLFPTAVEIAGGKASETIDAVSLLPLLHGESMPRDRDLYFVRREGGPAYAGKDYHAIVRGKWKLMQNNPFLPWELYDLDKDPQEQENLAAKRPELVRQLSDAIRNRIQIAGATPWQDPSAN